MSARGGIDLGGTKIQAVVVDGRNRVVGQARRPTPATGGGEAVVVELAGAMEDALASTSGRRPALSGIGVGAPGEIDAKRGTVAQARNVAGMDAPFPIG